MVRQIPKGFELHTSGNCPSYRDHQDCESDGKRRGNLKDSDEVAIRRSLSNNETVGNRKVKFDSKVNYLPNQAIGDSMNTLSNCIVNECKDENSDLNGDQRGWKIVQRSRKERAQKSG
jgi:hypothetical protein